MNATRLIPVTLAVALLVLSAGARAQTASNLTGSREIKSNNTAGTLVLQQAVCARPAWPARAQVGSRSGAKRI